MLRRSAQEVPGVIQDVGEIDDRFGGALAVTAADTDGFDDLVIGAYNEDGARGVAHVLRGGPQGITATGQAFWHQGKDKITSELAEAGDHFGWHVGGTSNGVIIVSAPDETFPGPTTGSPDVRLAGWAAIVRVNDASPILQSDVLESTESSITQTKTPLRDGGRFGFGLTAARPAFVAIQTSPTRYGGDLLSGSARLGDLCTGDTTPPVIHSVAATPSCMWPPNNKLVAYRLRDNLVATVTDDCDVHPDVRVTSVQVVDAGVPKQTPYFFGNAGVCLRAARSGGTREYIIGIEATDDHGNSSTATVTVQVPQSQASNGACPPIAPKAFVKDGDAACTF